MCRVLLIAASRHAHVGSTCFLFPGGSSDRTGSRSSGTARSAGPPSSPRTRNCRTLLVSRCSGARRARPNARRRSAMSRHPSSGCNHAPRPGRRRRRSGMTIPATATTRSNSTTRPFRRQPMQVRTGPGGPATAQARAAASGGRANIEVYRLSRPGSTWVTGSSTVARRATVAGRAPRHCGCRCATRSTGRPAGHSAPPCRWPGTAGSPVPPPGRPW